MTQNHLPKPRRQRLSARLVNKMRHGPQIALKVDREGNEFLQVDEEVSGLEGGDDCCGGGFGILAEGEGKVLCVYGCSRRMGGREGRLARRSTPTRGSLPPRRYSEREKARKTNRIQRLNLAQIALLRHPQLCKIPPDGAIIHSRGFAGSRWAGSELGIAVGGCVW